MKFPNDLVRNESQSKAGNGMIKQEVHSSGPARRLQNETSLPQVHPRRHRHDHSEKSPTTRQYQHDYRNNNLSLRISNRQLNRRKLLSPEEKALEDIYRQARQHAAIVARVTSPTEFKKMTVTLPAARMSPINAQEKKGWMGRAKEALTPNCSQSRTPTCTRQSTRSSTAAAMLLSDMETTEVYSPRHTSLRPRDCRSIGDVKKSSPWIRLFGAARSSKSVTLGM